MEWNLELGGAEAGAIALVVVCGTLLALVYWWNRPSPTAHGSAADLAEMHAAIERLQGELPALLESMGSRLDSKMQSLRRLLRDADAAIEQLRLASRSGVTERHCTPPSPAPTPAPTPPEPLTGQPNHIDHDSGEIPAFEPEQPGGELRLQRYAHVYSLADSGLEPAEIASETGMHRGEVELVLNLRQKRVRVDRGSRSEPSPVVRSPEEAPA